MPKREVAIGLGFEPEGGTAYDDEDTIDLEADSEDSEAEEDEAIDAALDTNLDPDARREAFRTAVQLCTKRY